MLPLTGSPKQRCRITATTFYLLKIFFRTYYLTEQPIFYNQHKYLDNVALKNGVLLDWLVIQTFIFYNNE